MQKGDFMKAWGQDPLAEGAAAHSGTTFKQSLNNYFRIKLSFFPPSQKHILNSLNTSYPDMFYLNFTVSSNFIYI